jgi:amino acid adenylation domain-containing protein
MQNTWNPDELRQVESLRRQVESFHGRRCIVPEAACIELLLSHSSHLKEGLSCLKNPGQLFMRQLLKALQFDERRIFGWRFDHKLVQALLLNSYAPGAVPLTWGASQEFCSLSPIDAQCRLQQLRAKGCFVKASLGEASGEGGQVDRTSVLSQHLGSICGKPAMKSLADEKFMIQKKILIRNEYRVHSIESCVIPELTFIRYNPSQTSGRERYEPNAFVQAILDRLPDGMIAGTLYGWDVAIDAVGSWFIIEANPAGFHPLFRKGFQCSGFFQTASWAAPCTATLLRFIENQYHLSIAVNSGAWEVDYESDYYWWVAMCKQVLQLRDRATIAGSDTKMADSAAEVDPRLSTEQNVFCWAVHELSRRPFLSPASHATPNALDDLDGHKRVKHVDEPSRASDVESPQAPAIHELFENRVRECPDAFALRCSEFVITYDELNCRANRLAHHLRALGLQVEDTVAVLLDRGSDLVVSILGILKAGGAYVPLSYRDPAARLSLILRESQVKIIVTDDKMRTFCENQGLLVLSYGIDEELEINGENLSVPVRSDNLAYVIFTSGSTGAPKGVGATHGGLSNVVRDLKERLQFTNRDSWLAITNISFDIAALELLLPITAGGCVHIPTSAQVDNPMLLMEYIAESGITFMQATPATWAILFRSGWPGSAGLSVLCGGDQLPNKLASELRSKCRKVWNLYGPTETTIWSSIYELRGCESEVPIGTALANTTLYVLDGNGDPVRSGSVGELYIGGIGVARGYINERKRTADKFIPDPFCGRPGLRMYRTGDLARWSSDAQLEFLGRGDFQIKLRGFRIELPEIERVLEAHPGICQAVVVVRGDSLETKHLAAHVVPVPGQALDIAALRRYLSGQVPHYMIPSKFTAVDRLPMTSNSKVDRKFLAGSIDQAMPNVETVCSRAADITDTERFLTLAWCEILDVDAIAVDDTILQLGGTSVSIMMCLNRVRAAFGIDVFENAFPLRRFFSGTITLREAAQVIDQFKQVQLTHASVSHPAA